MPWDTVMHRWKHGGLHSGSKNGPPVKSRTQAIAIMLSEKRKAQAGNKEYKGLGPSEKTVRKHVSASHK